MTGIRSYLAGTGASGSLLLAALVAFVSVTAFVAFEGVPIGSGDDGADTVSIDGPDSAAATAVAAAGPPAAVAATPAAPGLAAAGAPGAPGALGPGAAVGAPGAPAAGVPGAPGGGSATATDVPPVGPAPTPATNPVDDAVAGVDQTVQGATGVNPNLGGATKPVTGAVDDVLQGATGNDLGGHLDNIAGPGNRATGQPGLTP